MGDGVEREQGGVGRYELQGNSNPCSFLFWDADASSINALSVWGGQLFKSGRSGKFGRLNEPRVSVHKKRDGGADRRGRYQCSAAISPLEFFDLYSAALGFAAL